MLWLIALLQRIGDALENHLQSIFPRPDWDEPIENVPMNQPITPPPPPKPAPKYLWDTAEAARHSVRVIADEEGLAPHDKNEMCATVGAESGWQSYYLQGPKRGQPVKLENLKNGKVWSTDWGIAQINDYWWVRAFPQFPSGQYILDHPEECIRWMCRRWKTPANRPQWIAYKNGSFKNYL